MHLAPDTDILHKEIMLFVFMAVNSGMDRTSFPVKMKQDKHFKL